LYRGYLQKLLYCKLLYGCYKNLSKEIISNNTKCRKQILKFYETLWKYRWNETDNETLPVSAHFLWTSKFIFLSFHGRMLSVLFQAMIYIFSFKKKLKGLLNISNSLHLGRKYDRIFVRGHNLFPEKRTVFRERSSRKTHGELPCLSVREGKSAHC